MQDGSTHDLQPPIEASPVPLRDGARMEDIDLPTKEACTAWERSLRPGQYFSEKGGHRPMCHRTQAVQGHPGARAWPRGPDGGAWGPQDLSPIPSEKGYMPVAFGGTTPSCRGAALVTACPRVARSTTACRRQPAEVGLEGLEREILRPFEPIALNDVSVNRVIGELGRGGCCPERGAGILTRRAAALRGEAAAAGRDEEAVRSSGAALAELLRAAVENSEQNVSLGRERLRRLHESLVRLRRERRRDGEAVKAAVAWQESLEELREKLASAEDRRRRAERAKGDVQRALAAAVDANRKAEEEVEPLERELEAARRRDEVAAEMARQARQEELADSGRGGFGDERPRASEEGDFAADNQDDSNGGDGPVDGRFAVGSSGVIDRNRPPPPPRGCRCGSTSPTTTTSPLLLPTLSKGFYALVEACRRSAGMRRLAEARRVKALDERRHVVKEAFAAWALGAALERGERDARERRAVEVAQLCLARWKCEIADKQSFRAERWRRTCKRVLQAWRGAVLETRRDHDLEDRRQVLVLRCCFRGWRALLARSTLTPREYLERRTAADNHRLGRLFAAWHTAALASSASSQAVVSGVRRRRDALTLAADFRAWAPRVWGGGIGGAEKGQTYDSEALASAHRRRLVLSRGLRALRHRVLGSAAGLLRRNSVGQPFRVAVVVSGERGDAMAHAVWRRKRMLRATRGLRVFAVEAERERRVDRRRILRKCFGCAVSRRQHAACAALRHGLNAVQHNGKITTVLFLSLQPRPRTSATMVYEQPHCSRIRESVPVIASVTFPLAPLCTSRSIELESKRREKRDRDLAEELIQVRQEAASLQEEAVSLETELQCTRVLVREQEEALARSRRSLTEAAAAAGAVKARLNPAAPSNANKGRKGDRRLRSRRVAHRRGAARVLAEAESRRKEAERAAAAREKAAAEARGLLVGQEEADRAALEGALEAARRYAEALDQGQARVEKAEAERLRARKATAGLVERVDQLTRKAEEEASQGARYASGAESERAALALEVSTAEARAREMEVILRERDREAAEMRRALAAKDLERQEKCLLGPFGGSPTGEGAKPSSIPPHPPKAVLPLSGARISDGGGGDGGGEPMSGYDVRELKDSIALLQKKVESSRVCTKE
ncbi:unnamed protein product [Scytosiphon promiscuus]